MSSMLGSRTVLEPLLAVIKIDTITDTRIDTITDMRIHSRIDTRIDTRIDLMI